MRPRLNPSNLIAGAALFLLNAYLCREVFLFDHFGQMQSLRGFWEALARLAHFSWHAAWWRYSNNGMPLEAAYAPGVPVLIAGVVKLTGWPVGRAFGTVAGLAFCFGPVALFWMAAELTGRRWWSFAAAMAYSLVSPSEFLLPETPVPFPDPRRLMLVFAWDEAPHLFALALVLLSVACAVRGLRGMRAYFWLAAVCLALAMLASAFGGTLGIFFLGLLWLSWRDGNKLHNGLWIAGCGVAAYLAICPFYPPSLLRVIRMNSRLASDPPLNGAAAAGLLATVLGTALVFWLARNWRAWHLRFFLLLTFVFFAIPCLALRDLRFVPQPIRYKVELEAAATLLVMLSLALVFDRARPAWRVALVLVLLVPGLAALRWDRRYEKTFVRQSDVRQTIEYQVAAWLASNLPGQRVMAPGSTGFWMDAFTAQPQFTGGSWPTTPTSTAQVASWGILHLNPVAPRKDAARLWLEAYGVDALVVPGSQSPEYWKAFEAPAQFEDLFPLLWRQRDTSIYSVPRRFRSMASVVPRARLVQHTPALFYQLDEIGAYVEATEDPASETEWQWRDDNTAWARGNVPRGSVVSLHITFNPGWRATANGSDAPVFADGLEQLTVAPDCDGPCEIQLIYDGGTEAKATRAVSIFTILAAAAGLWRLRRAARKRVPVQDLNRSSIST